MFLNVATAMKKQMPQTPRHDNRRNCAASARKEVGRYSRCSPIDSLGSRLRETESPQIHS